jgi:hypothetical protein
VAFATTTHLWSYPLTKIASWLGVHYSTVSRIAQRRLTRGDDLREPAHVHFQFLMVV